MTSGQEAVMCQAAPSPVPAKQVVSPRGPGRSTLPAIPRHVNWAWGPPQKGYEATAVAGPLA